MKRKKATNERQIERASVKKWLLILVAHLRLQFANWCVKDAYKYQVVIGVARRKNQNQKQTKTNEKEKNIINAIKN